MRNDKTYTSLERYREDIARCVKCGTCSAVCPTYAQERDESFSARGRMALVKAVLDNRLPVSPIYRDRLASCTTCLACEAACPGNVPVTEIIQAAKEQAIAGSGSGLIGSVLAGVVKHPALFRAVAWLAPVVLHVSGMRMRKAEGGRRKKEQPGKGTRGTIGFFPGCAIDHFQPDIGTATVNVLAALGYQVVIPANLKCCGRPLLSLGDRAGARELAAHNVAVLAKCGADAIVTACASCGLTFKQEYPRLLPPGVKGPPVLDIHEFLAHALVGTARKPVHKTVTWHDPCHLGRGQGLSAAARNILGSLPGITVVEMKDADHCCGFGGVMRITHASLSGSIAGDKARNIMMTGAQVVVTGCPGCRMQLADALKRKDSDVEVLHTVQLLEEALGIAECGLRIAECEAVVAQDKG